MFPHWLVNFSKRYPAINVPNGPRGERGRCSATRWANVRRDGHRGAQYGRSFGPWCGAIVATALKIKVNAFGKIDREAKN
jgi:hypothetical protein